MLCTICSHSSLKRWNERSPSDLLWQVFACQYSAMVLRCAYATLVSAGGLLLHAMGFHLRTRYRFNCLVTPVQKNDHVSVLSETGSSIHAYHHGPQGTSLT